MSSLFGGLSLFKEVSGSILCAYFFLNFGGVGAEPPKNELGAFIAPNRFYK
jgi:hypothetical protein